jgi:predicted metal-dependent hydrolase
MQECAGQLHPRAREGIRLFNRGLYFEAHEELEAAWRSETGRIRELYQGILEAGVTYLHLRRGNLAGAEKVYRRSLRWLANWPDVCRGAHIGQLRRDLGTAVTEATRLGDVGLGQLRDDYFKPLVWREVEDG